MVVNHNSTRKPSKNVHILVPTSLDILATSRSSTKEKPTTTRRDARLSIIRIRGAISTPNWKHATAPVHNSSVRHNFFLPVVLLSLIAICFEPECHIQRELITGEECCEYEALCEPTSQPTTGGPPYQSYSIHTFHKL